jgi:hypothetical protein
MSQYTAAKLQSAHVIIAPNDSDRTQKSKATLAQCALTAVATVHTGKHTKYNLMYYILQISTEEMFRDGAASYS